VTAWLSGAEGLATAAEIYVLKYLCFQDTGYFAIVQIDPAAAGGMSTRDRECLSMLSPSGNTLDALDLDAGHFRAPQAPDREQEQATAERRPGGAAGDDDLQRLESSVQWLKRECMIARIETGLSVQKTNRRLPRASQLPPASGIAPAASTEGSCRKRETSAFRVRPPLASERLQFPPLSRRHRTHLPGALFGLIASVIAGSIAYHITAGEVFPAPDPAQAAPPLAPN
jgi:hypothetical protein